MGLKNEPRASVVTTRPARQFVEDKWMTIIGMNSCWGCGNGKMISGRVSDLEGQIFYGFKG